MLVVAVVVDKATVRAIRLLVALVVEDKEVTEELEVMAQTTSAVAEAVEATPQATHRAVVLEVLVLLLFDILLTQHRLQVEL